ncbi:nucleoside triphosphate pyrophosphohydrolase [Mariprofundus sp. KV]|uniref:nucleoside triphosphate pyrophosphohydrolase n=1 Tax=Mariprofundus sp. KV TaxID=2608715 RepID=UPI0015A0FF7E|nr:nucleoside triphosphate pyrophosphohydrolase [Mariprofundus sp. KV]
MPGRIKNKDNHYEKLYALMKVLREECPWDKEQTLLSLRRYTLEEVHEVLEAIDIADSDDNWEPLKSELGDLLIQVLFYSRIAEESDKFAFSDVIDALIDKMIYRHPHVFDKANPDDLTDQWNSLKDAEHQSRTSLMDEIPPLPALKYAQKQQQRAARVGFDWVKATDVLAKMREELDELEHEVTHSKDLKRIEDEFGDVLFTLANLARKLDLDAELCLMSTNRKFADRFRMMERLADQQGISLKDLDLDQQEELYSRSKSITG